MTPVVEIRTYKDSFCLIRAYSSLEELQRGQDAFYASDEWREGPREAIVSRIESSISVVLPAEPVLRHGTLGRQVSEPKQVSLTEAQIEFLLGALDHSARAVRDYANEHRSFGAERRDETDEMIASIRAALSAKPAS